MQAVLWDLDGTIIDSSPLHYRVWRATPSPRGKEYRYEDFVADFGRSNRAVLTDMFDGQLSNEEMDAIADEKEAAYRRLVMAEGVPILPGVMEWLARFTEAGWAQTISSSADMANIVAVCQVLEISDCFHALISGAKLPQGKPDPAIFLNSAASLALAPDDCLVIEDSIHGVDAAMRAGMACVAVGSVIETATYAELLADHAGKSVIGVETLNDLTWAQLYAANGPQA